MLASRRFGEALLRCAASACAQEEASAQLTAADWHSAQHAAVRARYARCRNLGFQCTALAVRYADSPDRRAQLLAGTGHRWVAGPFGKCWSSEHLSLYRVWHGWVFGLRAVRPSSPEVQWGCHMQHWACCGLAA